MRAVQQDVSPQDTSTFKPLAGTDTAKAEEEVECMVCFDDTTDCPCGAPHCCRPLMAQDQDNEESVEDLFGPDEGPASVPAEQLPPVQEEPAEDVNSGKPRRHLGNPAKE